jgi:hypothetical protein
MQQLLERRISAIEYDLLDLLHGDFNQGRTFKLLPDETTVQNWLASRTLERWAGAIRRRAMPPKSPDLRGKWLAERLRQGRKPPFVRVRLAPPTVITESLCTGGQRVHVALP